MPTNFSWDDPNALFLEVDKMLKTQGTKIRAVPERAVRRGTIELMRLIQAKMPKKTSTLVRSVNFVVRRISADLVEGVVGTPLAYAQFVEEGTGIYGPKRTPIIIMAKNRQALWWGAFNEKGKKLMVTRVTNPGMKAQHPFALAVAEFLPRYTEIINEELAKAAA
jgi:hypothetical protein